MIVQALQARPHLLLLGTRADPDAPASDQGQRVAAFVVRDVLGFEGAPADAGEVLLEDVPLQSDATGAPFRYESEIAPWKEMPDVVVVDDLLTILPGWPLPPQGQQWTEDEKAAAEAAIGASIFGTVAVARFTPAGPNPVFGSPVERRFGWLSRATGDRKLAAGDASNFPVAPPPPAPAPEPPEPTLLPHGFRNTFFNGRPLPGQDLFGAGDSLRFTQAGANPPGPWVVTMPSAPVLRIVDADGEPLQPPASMEAKVDTVVMDRGAGTFTIVWRAVLPWEERFAQATLVME